MKQSFIITALMLCLAERLNECSAQNVVEGCLNGTKFVAVDQTVDFETAITICSDMGALVAGITNEEEHDFVVNLIYSLGISEFSNFWIGNYSSSCTYRLEV